MLEADVIREVIQLGGTFATVIVFVWYLEKRDRAIQDTLIQLRDVIHELKGRMFNSDEDHREERSRRVK